MSIISGIAQANATTSAASTAANAQKDAAATAADVRLKMWEDTLANFAPFLELGKVGVAQLSSQIEPWLQQTVIPYYNQYMGFNYSQLPDPTQYAFDPVTGQAIPTRQQEIQGNAMSQPVQYQYTPTTPTGPETAPTSNTNAFAGERPTTPRTSTTLDVPGTTERGIMLNGEWVPEDQIPDQYKQQIVNPNYTASTDEMLNAFKGTLTKGELSSLTPFSGSQYMPFGLQRRFNEFVKSYTPMMDNPNYIPVTERQQQVQAPNTTNFFAQPQIYSADGAQPTANRMINVPTANAFTGNLEAGGVLSPTVPEFKRPMDLSQYAFNPNAPLPNAFASSAGLPGVPILSGDLDYQFNENDPVYLQKKKELTESVNRFLAKEGQLGSTSGNTYLNNQLSRLLAEEEARQYNRAVSEREFQTGAKSTEFGMGMAQGQEQFGRDVTGYGLGMDRSNTLYGRQLGENELDYQRNLGERNYLTQADIDQYNMMAGRGETLYGRMSDQQNNLYNRMVGNTLTTDQNTLNLLAQRYGLGTNLFGTLYGSATDLTKIGQGAAGSIGSGALSTAQGIAGSNLYAGDAAAQAALLSGNAMSNFYGGIQNMTTQALGNYFQNQSGGGYYNPYQRYAYGAYGGYNQNVAPLNQYGFETSGYY